MSVKCDLMFIGSARPIFKWFYKCAKCNQMKQDDFVWKLFFLQNY